MGNLVYQDDPWAHRRLPYREKLQAHWRKGGRAGIMHMFPILIAIFLVGVSVATQFEQDAVVFSILGITAFLMIVVVVALSPNKYQIFNDRIRIVLGWVFHFDIPFKNIANATAAEWDDLWRLNLNFINSYSSDDILQITRKRRPKVHITPWDRKLFLEHLNKALAEWRRSNPGT